MADTTLTVDIDTRQAISALNSLKSSILGVVGAASLKGLLDFSDSIVNIQNRLRTLNPDMATTAKQFEAINSIAMITGTPLAGVADSFTKLLVSTRDLGISQRAVADITSTMSKQLALSGVGSQEAASSMYQFNQAMALGKFQGNDLHSMLQTMPKVMQGFADSVGVPVGKLGELGAKGLILAEDFTRYMAKIKDSTDKAFKDLTPTVGRSVETLQTALSSTFAKLGGTQIGTDVATAILTIARNIDEFGKSAEAAGNKITWIYEILKTAAEWAAIAVGILAGGGALVALGRAFLIAYEAAGSFLQLFRVLANSELRAAFMENIMALPGMASVVTAVSEAMGPAVVKIVQYWKSITVAISGAVGAVYEFFNLKFGDGVEKATEATKNAKEKNDAWLESLKPVVDKQKEEAEQNKLKAQRLAEVDFRISKLNLTSKIQNETLKANLDYTLAKLSFDTKQIVNLDELGNVTANLTNKSKDQIEIDTALFELQHQRAEAIKRLTDEQAKLRIELSDPALKNDLTGTKEKRAEIERQIGVIGSQINAEKKLYDNQAKSLPSYIQGLQSARIIEEARKRDTEVQIKLIEDQIARQEKLGDAVRAANQKQFEIKDKTQPEQLVGLTSIERKLIDIQDANRKAGQEAKRAFAEAFGTVETLQQADELTRGINAIDDAYKRLGATEEEYAKGADQVQKAWSTGWADSFASFKEAAFNNADYARTIFQDATKGMEDAFVKFAQTGKLSFKDLADSIIADVIRIGIRRAIASGGEGGVGNIFSAFMGLFKAEGGPVSANSPYIVGEKGPEVFVPTTAGTIIPNSSMGGQSVGGTTVNYTIQAVDASSFRSLVARDPQFIYSVTEQGRRSQPTRRLS